MAGQGARAFEDSLYISTVQIGTVQTVYIKNHSDGKFISCQSDFCIIRTMFL